MTDLINEMKQSGFLQKTKLKDLPPKLEQLYMSQMSKKDVDYPLASSITKNLPYYGFIRHNDNQMLLQVLLESGNYLQFSIQIDDIFKALYLK